MSFASVIVLSAAFGLGQAPAGGSLADRWAKAVADYNRAQVLRIETSLRDLSRQSRQTKGVARQKVIAAIADFKKQLAAAKAGELQPRLTVADLAVGQMGYLDAAAGGVGSVRVVPAVRVLVFLDAVPALGRSGFIGDLGTRSKIGTKVVVEATTRAQAGQWVELEDPVEIVGTYNDLGGTYFVLRPFRAPVIAAAGGKQPTKSAAGKLTKK